MPVFDDDETGYPLTLAATNNFWRGEDTPVAKNRQADKKSNFVLVESSPLVDHMPTFGI